MRNNTLNIGVIPIGCRLRICQDKFGIKNIEALVLHSAHIEITHGHDHEALQIQLETKTLLIPRDRTL